MGQASGIVVRRRSAPAVIAVILTVITGCYEGAAGAIRQNGADGIPPTKDAAGRIPETGLTSRRWSNSAQIELRRPLAEGARVICSLGLNFVFRIKCDASHRVKLTAGNQNISSSPKCKVSRDSSR